MLKARTNDKLTRRGLFRSVARGAAAAGIATVGWLLVRGGRRGRPQSECINGARCRGCPLLDGCILPPAQYTRQAEAEES